MLTTNIYTGALLRKRQTFTGCQLFGLWCFLYVVLEATPLIVLSTDTCNLEFQCISLPSEFLTISGATTPQARLQALPPATAQAILDRAQRVANRAATNNTTTTPAKATPKPKPVALFGTSTPALPPHPIATYESSEDEENETKMATVQRNTINPRVHQGAFQEANFIIKQYTKCKTMKKGSRTEEELLAAQTDEVMETSELTQLQIEKLLDMQTAGHDVGPIKANTYMQNARMSARTWDNVDTILHCIIIIAKTL